MRLPPAVTVHGPPVERAAEVLTPEALDFVAALHRAFEPRRLRPGTRQASTPEGQARTGEAGDRAGDGAAAVTARQLLDLGGAGGECTLGGLRNAVAVFNLMEDVAAAEISRSQIWQWINNGVVLDTGETVTPELARRQADLELAALRAELGETAYGRGRWDAARALFEQVALGGEFVDFLTLPGHALLD